MNKTKAELMEELEEIKAELKNKEKEIEDLKRFEKYKEMGDELKAMQNAFIDSGFTETQAFKMLLTTVRAAAEMSRPKLF